MDPARAAAAQQLDEADMAVPVTTSSIIQDEFSHQRIYSDWYVMLQSPQRGFKSWAFDKMRAEIDTQFT